MVSATGPTSAIGIPQKNTGEAGVFYPGDFSGSSHVEIRDADGNVLDEGDVKI